MTLDFITEAVKLPFREQDWIKKILAGYVLTVASFLIIPAPLLIGYIVRVMREDTMPKFNNLLDMYLDGLKASAIIIVYLVPGVLIASFAQGNNIIAGIGFIVFLLGWWAAESGVYQLANNGFRQAFSKNALKTAFTLNYFKGILASIILPIAIFAAYMTSLLLIVTILLFPAVHFYATVVRYRIIKNAIEIG